MNVCCKKYIETIKEGFEDGSAKIKIGLNKCPYCKERLSTVIDSKDINPKHNPLNSIKLEDLIEMGPDHLLISKNSKADLNDRYRIYNIANGKHIKSTGSETAKGCLVKLFMLIAGEKSHEV